MWHFGRNFTPRSDKMPIMDHEKPEAVIQQTPLSNGVSIHQTESRVTSYTVTPDVEEMGPVMDEGKPSGESLW